MDFEKILHKCGDANRYQYVMLGLLGYIGFSTTVHYFSQSVIGFVPSHWCYHEELENRSFKEIAEIYAPFGKLASCTRLETINGLNVTVSNQTCTRWIYDYDHGFRSMNPEMNWVCDNAYKARVGQTLFFIGSLLGTFIFGVLGDKLGRVPALILSNQCGFLGDLLTSYVQNAWQFASCRLLSGLAADCNYYMLFILVLEYLPPKMRNLAFTGTLGVCFCLGGLFPPWVSIYVGNWRTYLLCSSFLHLAVLFFYLLLQESAQWLITRQNIDGAISRLKYIAKFNGRTVEDADFEAFRLHCSNKGLQQYEPNVKLHHMFRTPRLRKFAIIIAVSFMILSLSFNTISRNVEGLGMSPFIVFSLFSLIVMPSGIIQGIVQRYIGRKSVVFWAMFCTGLFACAVGTILSFENLRQNVMLVLGLILPMRFGLSMSYTSGSLYFAEIIPTCVRSRGLAATHLLGSAAAILSPFIIHLGTMFTAAPFLILTALLVTGGTIALMLPETNKKQLPITLEDGEAFGLGEPLVNLPCLRRHDDDVFKQPKEEFNLVKQNGNDSKTVS